MAYFPIIREDVGSRVGGEIKDQRRHDAEHKRADRQQAENEDLGRGDRSLMADSFSLVISPNTTRR